jgi:hypothetical protein
MGVGGGGGKGKGKWEGEVRLDLLDSWRYPGCKHPFIRVDAWSTRWLELLRGLNRCCVDVSMLINMRYSANVTR